IGDVGQDLAPRRRAPERPGDDLDETAARVLAALPVRRGVTVARLTVVAGLPSATVVGVLGRLELTGLAEREGQGWRQGAAARAFLRWAHHTGRIDSDPSLRLVAPRRTRTLPGVLRQDEASGLLELAAVAADDDDPVHQRDRAVLELLYATGIRVGELVGI